MTTSPQQTPKLVAQVALAVPVADFFDYLCPSHLPLPKIGARVLVYFGARRLIGVVIGLIDASDSLITPHKLKPIKQLIDDDARSEEHT